MTVGAASDVKSPDTAGIQYTWGFDSDMFL